MVNFRAVVIRREGDSASTWFWNPYDATFGNFKVPHELLKASGDISRREPYRAVPIYPERGNKAPYVITPDKGTKVSYYVPCENSEAEYLISKYYMGTHIQEVFKVEDADRGLFVLPERIRLWDNTITGFNALEWREYFPDGTFLTLPQAQNKPWIREEEVLHGGKLCTLVQAKVNFESLRLSHATNY